MSVWVYANVASVELLRNGTSLGVKSFDEKVTTYGRKYLETTEPTHDDYNYPSGSYTSPNGSTGKLHLTWTVPFEPGTLTAVARRRKVVARDEIRTAGAPHALTLTSDRRVISADGTSLAFLAVEVVDRAGVVVPGAANLIQFGLAGPAVLDGDPGTGWSNYYDKAKTANLLAVSVSNPADWVSVTWPSAQAFDSVQASFTISATLAQPASVTVSYWDGAGSCRRRT